MSAWPPPPESEEPPPPLPLGAWGDFPSPSSSTRRDAGLQGLGLGLTGGGFPPAPEPLYHLQFQQQRHLQQQQQHALPLEPVGFAFQQQQQQQLHHHHQQQLQYQQQPHRFPRQHQPPPLPLPPPPPAFDLSQSLQQLRLSARAEDLDASPQLADPFASWGSGASTQSGMAMPPTGMSLRDQMNQQMAALYQREAAPPPPVLGHHQHQAPEPHGQSLLSLLGGSIEDDHHPFGSSNSSSNVFPDLPDLSSSQLLGSAPPLSMMPRHQQQSPFRGQQSPFRGQQQHQPPMANGVNNPHLLRQVRRSPTPPPPLPPPPLGHSSFPNSRGLDHGFNKSRGERDASTGVLSSDLASSIEVTPEVTKPNGTIKVQVSLLAEECSPGRVLMVGLFRTGQVTNERPIFVKQVLFENKLNRNYRFLNTRITFRAPRSPGEFEFRVFESRKTHNGMDDRDAPPSYSNVTIARSNKLKVTMEYAHFIETLRGTSDKFHGGLRDGDSGAVMSSLLSIMRLVDQVETVFLHGNVLFSEFVEACLQLVSMNDAEIRNAFVPIDSVPNPMESFHGTMRNVLNGIQANPFVKELIADDVLVSINTFQQELYCQASGYYFATAAARHAYWKKHFGFAPFAFSSSDEQGQELLRSAFVRQSVSTWITSEARSLIPDKNEFRRTRQAIYEVVHAHVVSRLPIKADLDVFGSSANDFGTAESDMDMCLVLEKPSTTEEKQQILRLVVALLERQPHLFTDIDTARLTARIPIVMFRMKESGAECDLSVENVLAQRNTSFLRAYANADERVRVLAYVLKRFVKRRRMNSPAEGTLSSYGYLLMLIHYLQRQEPPILPVLQTLSPSWDGSSKCDCTPSRVWCSLQSPRCSLSERHPEMNLPSVICKGPTEDNDGSAGRSGGKFETYFYDPFGFQDPDQKLQLLSSFGARNTASVGELLIGFFEYFGLLFDASRQVVSVRMARTLSKEEKKRESQWRMHTRLSIEDPFEIAYDVAHVLKTSRDKYIRQQFARAYTLLVQGSLDASGHEVAEDRIANLMAELVEEVHEPLFLQPAASANASAATGADDDSGEGGDGSASPGDRSTGHEQN